MVVSSDHYKLWLYPLATTNWPKRIHVYKEMVHHKLNVSSEYSYDFLLLRLCPLITTNYGLCSQQTGQRVHVYKLVVQHKLNVRD